MGEFATWLVGMVVGMAFGVAVGVMAGVSTERTYQCDHVGGQMVGSKACIKGHEVLIQWPT